MGTPKNRPQGAAFVIGGSGGLGSAICRALAQEWDGLYFTYHSNEQAARELQQDISEGCQVAYGAVDLRDAGSIETALAQATDRFGKLGTVVFAGGVAIEQPYVADIRQAQWDEVFDVELAGFTRLVRAAIPVLRSQGGGNLVAVVSFAPYHFPPGDALSAVPKAAIEVLCRAIAREEGRNGIRANSVAPGIINAGLGNAFQEKLFTPEVWAEQRRRVPLKRFGESREIADCVAFLASDRASYVTGQTIIVDGGLQL
jgi:NAD(P)-dependent dehydrogenase (short-subunit alcohol dehydrogenase family)